MFKKVLVANRGEIAVRIIRTLKEMGIKSVAVYSEADIDSLHVKIADEAVCIGPAEAKKSYLSMSSILSAADITDVDAIHPGYGFLAENSSFSEACKEHEIKFIGPSTENMQLMGNKALAKKKMREAGLPVIPGIDVDRDLNSAENLVKRSTKEVGFPVLVKAAFGGGGKGIRKARDIEELKNVIESAQIEADAAFGDGHVYLEKYLKRPRHVEIQVVADSYGNVSILGDRDCSTQRRHQKLVEESPCSVIDNKIREKIFDKVEKAVKEINYQNAGTLEFLLGNKGNLYFMEMNTRLQVEHPVSEMVTGVDIVKEQILVAAGERLDPGLLRPEIKGHSIEFRINAENPYQSFMPSPGKIEKLHFPGGFGVRVDSYIYQGYGIPPFYDSLLGKIIVWAKNRDEAISRGIRALQELDISGIDTTKQFHINLLKTEDFKKGKIYTGYLEEKIEEVMSN